MLLKLNKDVFDSIDDAELWSVCFEPIISVYKDKMSQQTSDNEQEIKLEFYRLLNDGQRALFMFLAFYNHAKKSLGEFYWWSAYYYAQPKVWKEIKASFMRFETEDMLQILEKMEDLLSDRNYPRSLVEFTATFEDIHHDSELLMLISPLNDKFIECSPWTLLKIGKYIRSNPNDYVQFNES